MRVGVCLRYVLRGQLDFPSTEDGQEKTEKTDSIDRWTFAWQVPYGEPMWLNPNYKQSPYFKPSHFAVQKAMRKFIDEHVYPDAQACEESGKRMSQKILDMMGENNLHAMRQGPGEHLKGRKLFGGAVEPEEFDYFHEMIINQELSRLQARGYADGEYRGLVFSLETHG